MADTPTDIAITYRMQGITPRSPRELRLNRQLPPIPPGVDAPALRRVLDELARLRRESAEAHRAVVDITNQRQAAIDKDTAATAAAIRAGKPLPDRTAEKEHAERLAAANNKYAGYVRVIQQVEEEVRRVAADPALLASAAKATEQATEAVREALDQLREAHAHLTQCRQFMGWLQGGKQLPATAAVGKALAEVEADLADKPRRLPSPIGF